MRTIKVNCLLPQRLDQYLIAKLPALNQGRVNKAFRENKVKLNGKKQPLSTRVVQGDVITLYIPEEQLSPAAARGLRPEELIYQDDNIMVVNKAAGLPVVSEDGGDSLTARAKAVCLSARLCHRLDTGTSGLILLAKNDSAEAAIVEMLRQREIQKTYLCVTFGRPKPAQATLQGFLQKDSAGGRVFVHSKKQPGDKEITTRYDTIAVSGRLALLQVELITGRTHQIRAHLSSIGCPILGDSKYGNNAANRELKLKYQALCAWQLQFPAHISNEALAPLSGKIFHAPKPWYYQQILDGTLK